MINIEDNGMYLEHILDHYKNPHNFGTLAGSEHLEDVNPLCGDKAEIFVIFNKKKIKDIKFKANGCAISIASASILTDFAKGKSKKEIMKMERKQMEELVGIQVAPMRVKCMMLGLNILKRIIYEGDNKC